MNFSSLPWPLSRVEQQEKRQKKAKEKAAEEEEEFGLTSQLLDFVSEKITIDIFKSFHLQDDQVGQSGRGASPLNHANEDLSEWQKRHAMLLLSKSKEISQIRYALCPRYMKDNQFWRIYFLLVKNYVAPYEMRAMQKAKLEMDMEKVNSSCKVLIEVEMMESKLSYSPDAPLHDNGRSCRDGY
ncbi:hypothetical protein HPP92_006987 [Vanilla planifolia]|uniref:BSD domain-containing protein n=1 Tax=Vanilla planifolia TaxID=51239 RepID=A0A835RJG4_VANPL|nr:hypothetical protein HPP92_006987 [Vanilla planifolia]